MLNWKNYLTWKIGYFPNARWITLLLRNFTERRLTVLTLAQIKSEDLDMQEIHTKTYSWNKTLYFPVLG